MISLATFRFVGRHAINLLSGIYLAAGLAHLIGKFMPSLQVWSFIFLSLLWILTGIAVIIRELHGGRDSLAELGIGTLPPVIVGSVAVLLIARVVAHYEPSPGVFSVMVAEAGLFFWVGGYLLMLRNAYHKKKLDEDLAKKPTDHLTRHSS